MAEPAKEPRELRNSKQIMYSLPGPRQEKQYKCILLGEPCVGKTCLFNRISEGKFTDSLQPTTDSSVFLKRKLLPTGTMVALEIWDTAGQERFRSLTFSYFRNAKAALVVYDIYSKLKIADQLKDIKFHLSRDNKLDVLVFLVGTKADLGEEFAFTENEIQTLSKNQGVHIKGHFLVSSLSGQNVENLVKELARMLDEAEKKNQFELSTKIDTIRLEQTEMKIEKKPKNQCC